MIDARSDRISAPHGPAWSTLRPGGHPPGSSTAATSTGKDDLKAKAIGALRRLQKMPGLVRAFFADPHLRYITTAA
jgi:hypothetical protein